MNDTRSCMCSTIWWRWTVVTLSALKGSPCSKSQMTATPGSFLRSTPIAPSRSPLAWIRWTKERHDRRADSCRHMHRTAIVAHKQRGPLQDRCKELESHLSCQHDRTALRRSHNLLGQISLLCASPD